MKSQISRRALIARINRRLASDGRELKATRTQADRAAMGEHFIVEIERGRIVAANADLLGLAKELGVLKAYEQVTED
jgi:hypothetical protein